MPAIASHVPPNIFLSGLFIIAVRSPISGPTSWKRMLCRVVPMAGAKGIRLTRASDEEPWRRADTGSLVEGGVSLLGHHFEGAANLAASASQHLIRFRTRGSLGRDVLLRIREHVVSRLNE